MMLFVANIGSTMAKMFAFVFSRITMIFCCRMSAKKKRALALKNRQKAAAAAAASVEKPFPMPMKLTTTTTTATTSAMPTTVVIDEKPPMEDVRGYPANIRLNMLTGLTNLNSSRSLTSSNSSMTGDRSKDAIGRINELIRQESLQNIQEHHEQPVRQRRKSAEFSPIEYYIKETNKLTQSLTDGASIEKLNDEKSVIDEQVKNDHYCL